MADREALLQAVRALAAAAQPLADSVAKIAANDLATRAIPEARGLRGLLRRFRRAAPEKVTHQVEYLDGAVMRAEKIDLEAFLDEVTRQSRLLAALARPDGETAAKVQRATEKSLAEFVDRQQQALQLTYRRLAGLSERFRRQAPAEGALKGIKIELTLLKNCLIRCNQLRHQHGAVRERPEEARVPARVRLPPRSAAVGPQDAKAVGLPGQQLDGGVEEAALGGHLHVHVEHVLPRLAEDRAGTRAFSC